MDKEYEQVEDPHPDFLKGYNEGYALAKFAPEIGGIFGMYAGETERGKGFRKGKEQYVAQLEKDRTQEMKKDASDNKRDIEEGKVRDHDSLLKDYNENLPDMGVEKNDRFLDWLDQKDENKSDMDLDRLHDKDKDDPEPELE